MSIRRERRKLNNMTFRHSNSKFRTSELDDDLRHARINWIKACGCFAKSPSSQSSAVGAISNRNISRRRRLGLLGAISTAGSGADLDFQNCSGIVVKSSKLPYGKRRVKRKEEVEVRRGQMRHLKTPDQSQPGLILLGSQCHRSKSREQEDEKGPSGTDQPAEFRLDAFRRCAGLASCSTYIILHQLDLCW